MSERLVADTNILVSAVFWDGNESKIIELAEEGELKLLTSIPILNELKEVLAYEKFQLSEETINERIEYYLVLADTVPSKSSVEVIQEDPEDNKVLACAIQGDADYVVSGDEHLLNLKEFKEVKIVTASRLLEILGS